MKNITLNKLAVILVLMSGFNANAAIYDLALTAVGGPNNGETLFTVDPFNPPTFISNLSSIEISESIVWGVGGTSATYDADAIEINYFGTTYDLSDALGPVTAEWLDGQLIDINYETADFVLAITPSYNTKEWQGNVIVSAVPVPGALWFFASALGALGMVARRK